MTTITRSQVVEACRVLGFDARDLVAVTMRQGEVSVTSIVRDDNGHPALTEHGYAKTTTTYPVVDEEDQTA